MALISTNTESEKLQAKRMANTLRTACTFLYETIHSQYTRINRALWQNMEGIPPEEILKALSEDAGQFIAMLEMSHAVLTQVIPGHEVDPNILPPIPDGYNTITWPDGKVAIEKLPEETQVENNIDPSVIP